MWRFYIFEFALLFFFAAFRPAHVRADDIKTAGDILQFALPASALTLNYAYDDLTGTKQLAESLAASLAVTYALKYTVNEERPNGGKHSFPSGHTSAAFSSASFIQMRYGWEYGIPAYGAAAFVGYSRVEAREHHTQDVLASTAIGILSSYIFTAPYEDTTVQAEIGSGNYMLTLSGKW